MTRRALPMMLTVLAAASLAGASEATPQPARVVAQAQAAWLNEMRASARSGDRAAVARLLVTTAASCRSCQALSFIWSPDSRSLIVGSAGTKGNQLQLVPIDGTATILARSATPGVFHTPVFWTPNGKSLVYGEGGTTLAYPGVALRQLTPATGRTRTLWHTPNAQGANGPHISPNGREWAYISEIDQYHQRLRNLDTATGKVHVARGVNRTNLVAWSPDSRGLAVIESGWHVVTVAADGRLLHRIGPGRTIFWGPRPCSRRPPGSRRSGLMKTGQAARVAPFKS